jgi:uncharacterized protein YodC (DUF2158 family)
MDQEKWNVGQSAQKKTGGPIMTVVKIYTPKQIAVAWFEEKKMRREIVSDEELKPVR